MVVLLSAMTSATLNTTQSNFPQTAISPSFLFRSFFSFFVCYMDSMLILFCFSNWKQYLHVKVQYKSFDLMHLLIGFEGKTETGDLYGFKNLPNLNNRSIFLLVSSWWIAMNTQRDTICKPITMEAILVEHFAFKHPEKNFQFKSNWKLQSLKLSVAGNQIWIKHYVQEYEKLQPIQTRWSSFGLPYFDVNISRNMEQATDWIGDFQQSGVSEK